MSNRFNQATQQGPAQTLTDSWATPKYIIDKLGGHEIFDLDPCQFVHPEKGIITKTAKRYFTERDDGLSKPWAGNVFCNPPYSDLGSWLGKMANHNRGIVLCFLRADTKKFQEYVRTATGINMIKGRIKFLNSNGEEKGNGNAASCLIAWGEDNYLRIKTIDGIYCRVEV